MDRVLKFAFLVKSKYMCDTRTNRPNDGLCAGLLVSYCMHVKIQISHWQRGRARLSFDLIMQGAITWRT